MDLERNSVIKFEEVEKRMHALSKKTTATNTAVNEINSSIDILNKNLEDVSKALDKSIENFSNNVTINFFDIKRLNEKRKGFANIFIERLHFLCDTSSRVKFSIELDLNFFSTTSYNATLYIFLNATDLSKEIHSEKFTYNGTSSKKVSFEYDFHPIKENNFITFRMVSGITIPMTGSVEFESIKITIYGKDIILLNRTNDFKVYISKDYYYLTKNSNQGNYYLLAPSSNVDLSATFNPIPNLIPENVSSYNSRYYPFNYTYMPKIFYNISTYKYEIDHSVEYFAFCNLSNFLITSGVSNPQSGVASLIDLSNKGYSYTFSHPGNSDLTPQNLAFVNSNPLIACQPGMTHSEALSSSNVSIKLNGQPLPNLWVSNSMVFAKKWEEKTDYPYMCIATDEFGDNYFFPARSATYMIPLGKGVQVNAFLQDDNNITVYMRWIDTVYKKILTLNPETSKYELSDDITEFENAWEVIEGYSSDYFINKKGTWVYIPAT